MPFQENYTLLNSVAECVVIRTATEFSLETKVDNYIKKISQKAGWKYHKLDTIDQLGFPDILLLRRDTFWLIESKLLKRKKLVSLENNLDWQFGQIGYMKRAFTLKLNYMLAVGKGSKLAFIKGVPSDAERTCYPDFVRQI